MSDDAIIPFGKYKGRPILEVIESDPNYLQWLSGQDWFRTKYIALHQTIINRGAEPEETPEHNALQVLFLDDDFCINFFSLLVPGFGNVALGRFQQVREKNLALVQEEIEKNKARLAKIKNHSMGFDFPEHCKTLDNAGRSNFIESARKQLPREEAEIAELSALQDALSIEWTAEDLWTDIGRTFEREGVDVTLDLTVSLDEEPAPLQHHWQLHYRWTRFDDYHLRRSIEIKPTVGDDYPSVLRQMRANGSKILFLDRYTGQGATREQFIKTFASAGMRVVFRNEVAATAQPDNGQPEEP